MSAVNTTTRSLATRRISRSPRAGSRKWWRARRAIPASNVPFENGRASATARTAGAADHDKAAVEPVANRAGDRSEQPDDPERGEHRRRDPRGRTGLPEHGVAQGGSRSDGPGEGDEPADGKAAHRLARRRRNRRLGSVVAADYLPPRSVSRDYQSDLPAEGISTVVSRGSSMVTKLTCAATRGRSLRRGGRDSPRCAATPQ
jgi:hypothetical protein